MAGEADLINRINAISKGYIDMLSKFDNEEDRKAGLYEKSRLQFDVDCKRDIYALLTKDNPESPSFEEYMEFMDGLASEK